jgi:hypothetical protein
MRKNGGIRNETAKWKAIDERKVYDTANDHQHTIPDRSDRPVLGFVVNRVGSTADVTGLFETRFKKHAHANPDFTTSAFPERTGNCESFNERKKPVV